MAPMANPLWSQDVQEAFEAQAMRPDDLPVVPGDGESERTLQKSCSLLENIPSSMIEETVMTVLFEVMECQKRKRLWKMSENLSKWCVDRQSVPLVLKWLKDLR